MTDPIIEDVKHRLDIVDIISNYVTLRKSGVNYKAPCPFHNEKTPSFMVNKERQLYRCFGCGESGDIFAFVMKQENVDFAHALELLANKAGVALPEKSFSRNKSLDSKSNLVTINNAAAKFFNQVLVSHGAGEAARNYLRKRGVSDVSINRFQIGYAPQTNQTLQALFRKLEYKGKSIQDAGSPDRFRLRIMFPFRDVIGQVIGFAGRSLGDQVPKYLNTSETNLFHKNRYLYGLYEAKKAIAAEQKIVLVEGQLDVVMAHQAGTHYAVATSGTALTDDHLTILRRYSENLVLGFDSDSAGQKATERAIRMAVSHDFDVKVIVMPEGADPGDLAAHSPEKWSELVNKPVEAIEWLFTHYFPGQSSRLSSSARTKVYEALFPYLMLQKDTVSRSYMFQRLALLLGLTNDQPVYDAFSHWENKQTAHPSTQPSMPVVAESTSAEAPTLSEAEVKRREQHVIGLLALHPQLLDYKELYLQDNDFAHTALLSIYKSIKSWYTGTTTKSSDQLVRSIEQMLPPKALEPFQKLLFDIQTQVADFSSEEFLREYTITVQHIRQRLRENRIQSFAERIARAESAGDRAQVVQLIQEMQTALKKD